MSVGLIALLDDIAALAKVAAASLDDVGAQAMKAGAKAAGVVIDDAAVTPRYVVGFAAARELPIVKRIAIGSLKNKLLFLLPAALALSLVAPWAITPLLMLGGAYLCFEGAEKVIEALFPHHGHGVSVSPGLAEGDRTLEDQKVASAIQTDFILSAEIMAITLATVPEASFLGQATVLAVVGIGITIVVYGAVALIVKADDAGVALAQTRSAPVRALGRGIVLGMPYLLKLLAIVGTAAMVWVGGGIILHGLEEYGLAGPAHALHVASDAAAAAMPAIGGLASWFVTALGSGILGLILGAALVPVVEKALIPAWRRLRPAA
jgi:predicted DNA repair protein MutK